MFSTLNTLLNDEELFVLMLSVGHRPTRLGLSVAIAEKLCWPFLPSAWKNEKGMATPGKVKTVPRRREILSADITGLDSAKRISSGDLELNTLFLFSVVTYPASQNQDTHRPGLQTLQCTVSSADDQDVLCPSPVTLYLFPAIPASTAAFPVPVVYSILRMRHLHRSTSTLP